MSVMTLRELCETYQISRRTIQGYEKSGLIHASGKNKMGHLLYDTNVQAQICEIRFYQQMGFSLKEIPELLNAPYSEQREAILRQIHYLETEKERLTQIINQSYQVINSHKYQEEKPVFIFSRMQLFKSS